MCRLLANAETNEIVEPIDRDSMDEGMGFLAKQLVAVQWLVLGEENQVVSMLPDTIPCGLKVQHSRIACTILFDENKGIAGWVTPTNLALMDSDLCPYLAALLIMALYEARDVI